MTSKWPKVRLKDVCVVDWGDTSLTKKSYVPDGLHLAVSAAGPDGRINRADHKANTPVLSAIGAQCGKMFFPTEDFTAIKNTITLTPRDGVSDGKFLYYLFTYIDLPQRGAGQPFISKGDIQAFEVALPPLDEQKRIVAKLDEALGNLDKANKRLSETFSESSDLWESTLTLVFESSARGGTENLHSLREVCDDPKSGIVDGPFGSNLKRSDFIDSGIPVLKIQNIKTSGINLKKMDYVNESKYAELKRHSFSKGDIVLTKLGDPLGISAIVEDIDIGLIVADLVRIRVSKKVDARFICYQLNSEPVRNALNKQQKGTTRPRVTLQMVRDLPLFCPPIEEQIRIVAKLDALKAEIEGMKLLKQKTMSEVTHLRSSILRAAFAGDF